MYFILLIIPLGPVAHDHCDLVELNHFHDENGRLVFDQVIWYDWHPGSERHQVVAHRLIGLANPTPERDWKNGGYTARWQDVNVLRCVRADEFRETWTQHDPEIAEREHLHKDDRRGFSRLTSESRAAQ